MIIPDPRRHARILLASWPDHDRRGRNKVYILARGVHQEILPDRLPPGRSSSCHGIPDDHAEGMRRIVRLLGALSELAAEEVSRLRAGVRLDVIRALEEGGVIGRHLRMARSHMKWTRGTRCASWASSSADSVPTLLNALEDRIRTCERRGALAGPHEAPAAEEALVGCSWASTIRRSRADAAICIEMGPRTGPPDPLPA